MEIVGSGFQIPRRLRLYTKKIDVNWRDVLSSDREKLSSRDSLEISSTPPAISADGRFCAVPVIKIHRSYLRRKPPCRYYSQLRVYNTSTAERVSILGDHDASVRWPANLTQFSLSGDGTVALVKEKRGSFGLWNAQTGHPLGKWDGWSAESSAKVTVSATLKGLYLSPDGGRAVFDYECYSGDERGYGIRFHDTQTTRSTAKFAVSSLLSSPPSTRGFAVSRNGQAAFVLSNKNVSLVDSRSPKPVFSVKCFSRSRPKLDNLGILTDRDGALFVITSSDEERLDVWDSRVLKMRQTIRYSRVTKTMERNRDKVASSITSDGSLVLVSDCLCDLKRGTTSRIARTKEIDYMRGFYPLNGAISGNGKTAVILSVSSHKLLEGGFSNSYVASICILDVPGANMLDADIGPRGSVVPLGSEILRLFLRYMNGKEFPSKPDILFALQQRGRAYEISTMTDIYCAHVLIRTLHDKGMNISVEEIPDEDVQVFLWRCVYIKMTSAAKTDDDRELARRIMLDSKKHGFISKHGIMALQMGLHKVAHMGERFGQVSGVMRDIEKRIIWRIEGIGKTLRALDFARETNRRVAWVKFGISLVPVVGGACAAFIDAGSDIIFSLDAEQVVAFLTGSFNSLAEVLADARNDVSAEARLTKVAYSREFDDLLESHCCRDAKSKLEKLAIAAFGSSVALHEALSLEFAKDGEKETSGKGDGRGIEAIIQSTGLDLKTPSRQLDVTQALRSLAKGQGSHVEAANHPTASCVSSSKPVDDKIPLDITLSKAATDQRFSTGCGRSYLLAFAVIVVFIAVLRKSIYGFIFLT